MCVGGWIKAGQVLSLADWQCILSRTLTLEVGGYCMAGETLAHAAIETRLATNGVGGCRPLCLGETSL